MSKEQLITIALISSGGLVLWILFALFFRRSRARQLKKFFQEQALKRGGTLEKSLLGQAGLKFRSPDGTDIVVSERDKPKNSCTLYFEAVVEGAKAFQTKVFYAYEKQTLMIVSRHFPGFIDATLGRRPLDVYFDKVFKIEGDRAAALKMLNARLKERLFKKCYLKTPILEIDGHKVVFSCAESPEHPDELDAFIETGLLIVRSLRETI